MTTYTGNYRIPHLDQNVAEPEIPENTAKEIIDSALTKRTQFDFTSDADMTITHSDDPTQATDWQSFIFNITDDSAFLTATKNVNLPDGYARPYIFENNTAQSLTFKTVSGSGFVLNAGLNAYAYCDGTNIVRIDFVPVGSGSTIESMTDSPVGYGAVGDILQSNGSTAFTFFNITTALAAKLNHTGGTITNSIINGTTVTDYGETSVDINTASGLNGTYGNSGSLDIDLSDGSVFEFTPSGATTFTFTTTHTNTSFTMLLTNGGSNITWPTIKWEGGSEPVWSASGDDLITFTKIGSVWIGGALIGVA